MTTNDITLGFDPGGGDRFGCCVLRCDGVQTKTVRSIEGAIRWVTAECGGDVPISAGIDTLLHWSDGSAGWRRVDRLLKKTYPEASKSVVAPNSLYGAMVVGGVGLAIRLRERWPSIALTETHPTVLFHALRGTRYIAGDIASAAIWFAEKHALPNPKEVDEHQFDALISAWAAREGRNCQWADLCQPHSNDMIFPAGPVSYLWPIAT